MRISIALIAMVAVVAGCKKQTSSGLKVIGGVEDYTSFPAAIGLLSKKSDGTLESCTGTIVRDDLVLTAAHCINDAVATVIFDRLGDNQNPIKARSQVIFPGYPGSEKGFTGLSSDVAFLIFDKGTLAGRAAAAIAGGSVKAGEQVRLVGYGRTDFSTEFESNPQLKRFSGTNQVSEIDGPAIILKSATVGMTTSGVSNGDSGGPQFNVRGEVVGIADRKGMIIESDDQPSNAAINSNQPAYSFYINVTDPGVASFIHAVMSDSNPSSSSGSSAQATAWDWKGPQSGSKSGGGSSSSGGKPSCTSNGGEGYGDAFTCGSAICAKQNSDYTVECVRGGGSGSSQGSGSSGGGSSSSGGKPSCTSNGGQGYGDAFTCGSAICAKQNSDYTVECVRGTSGGSTSGGSSSSGGRPACISNNGQGYGDAFTCGSATCAKQNSDYTVECVRSSGSAPASGNSGSSAVLPGQQVLQRRLGLAPVIEFRGSPHVCAWHLSPVMG